MVMGIPVLSCYYKNKKFKPMNGAMARNLRRLLRETYETNNIIRTPNYMRVTNEYFDIYFENYVDHFENDVENINE